MYSNISALSMSWAVSFNYLLAECIFVPLSKWISLGHPGLLINIPIAIIAESVFSKFAISIRIIRILIQVNNIMARF